MTPTPPRGLLTAGIVPNKHGHLKNIIPLSAEIMSQHKPDCRFSLCLAWSVFICMFRYTSRSQFGLTGFLPPSSPPPTYMIVTPSDNDRLAHILDPCSHVSTWAALCAISLGEFFYYFVFLLPLLTGSARLRLKSSFFLFWFRLNSIYIYKGALTKFKRMIQPTTTVSGSL